MVSLAFIPVLFASLYIPIHHNQVKYVKDLNIGDTIKGGIIRGIIKISPKYLDKFLYKNKNILSGNIKIKENDLWLNVCDSIYSKSIELLSYFLVEYSLSYPEKKNECFNIFNK